VLVFYRSKIDKSLQLLAIFRIVVSVQNWKMLHEITKTLVHSFSHFGLHICTNSIKKEAGTESHSLGKPNA
jgi:hypothetical protein